MAGIFIGGRIAGIAATQDAAVDPFTGMRLRMVEE